MRQSGSVIGVVEWQKPVVRYKSYFPWIQMIDSFSAFMRYVDHKNKRPRILASFEEFQRAL